MGNYEDYDGKYECDVDFNAYLQYLVEQHLQTLSSEDLRDTNIHDNLNDQDRKRNKNKLKPCFEESSIILDPNSINDVW